MAAREGRNSSERSKPRKKEREAAATPPDLSICEYQKAFTRSTRQKKKESVSRLGKPYSIGQKGRRKKEKEEERQEENE